MIPMTIAVVVVAAGLLCCLCDCQRTNYTTTTCKGLNDICKSVQGSSQCQSKNTKFFCTCDPGNRVAPGGASCLVGCHNGTTCQQLNISYTCVQINTTTRSKYCAVVPCETNADCSHLNKATVCSQADDLVNETHCGPNKDEAVADQTDDSKGTLDNTLLYGVVGMSLGVVLTVASVAVIMTGKCSGDVGAAPKRGRGVQAIRQRFWSPPPPPRRPLPPPPTPPPQPRIVPVRQVSGPGLVRRPSVASLGGGGVRRGSVVAARRPSMSSLGAGPRRMSVGGPASSVALARSRSIGSMVDAPTYAESSVAESSVAGASSVISSVSRSRSGISLGQPSRSFVPPSEFSRAASSVSGVRRY